MDIFVPGDRILASVNNDKNKAVVITNELVSYAYSKTTVAGTATNGNHMIVNEYNWIFNLPSPPSNFKIYAASCNQTGTNWQGITTSCQTLIYWEIENKGTVTLEKNSLLPSITENNDCYFLEQAVYGIYTDAACTTLFTTISPNETLSLDSNTYYLKEIEAGNGYEINEEILSFTVENNTDNKVKVHDKPFYHNSPLILKKRDSQTYNGICDTQFKIQFYGFDSYSLEECEQMEPLKTWVFKTDSNGCLYFDEDHFVSGDEIYKDDENNPILPLGTLILEEKKPAQGYLKQEQKVLKNICDTEFFSYSIFYNDKNEFTIYKYQDHTPIPIKDTVFVHTFNEKEERLITDENGCIHMEGLEIGMHSLQEEKANKHYQNENIKLDFEVKEDGIYLKDEKVNQVIFENKVKDFSLQIHKTDPFQMDLENVTFTLFKDEDCTQIMDIQTTDEKGICTFEGLENNMVYYCKETQGLDGYEENNNIYVIRLNCVPVHHQYDITINTNITDIDIENHIIRMNVLNTPVKKLPVTGNNGQLMIFCTGTFLMIIVLGRKRNEKEKYN